LVIIKFQRWLKNTTGKHKNKFVDM